jgi:predicted deacylase
MSLAPVAPVAPAAPAAPAIELQAPDIACWRQGQVGVDWVHVLPGEAPGPKVLVQALTHGNEICGAIALHWLLQHIQATGWRPLNGQLTLVFANVAAYQRFDPAQPFHSRFVDEDLNRVWADAALDSARDSSELRRARALRPFVDNAQWLLDIHSMGEPGQPLMVCGTLDKHAAFARRLGTPATLLIDTGHPAGLRMVERGRFGDPAAPECALLIECGQHWERSAAEVAIDTLVRFLGLTGLATPEWVQAHSRCPLPERQRLVRVTEPVVARSADFRFLVPIINLGVVPRAGTPIAQDGSQVWHAPCDDTVLVMPGLNNLKPGATAVRLGRFEA